MTMNRRATFNCGQDTVLRSHVPSDWLSPIHPDRRDAYPGREVSEILKHPLRLELCYGRLRCALFGLQEPAASMADAWVEDMQHPAGQVTAQAAQGRKHGR